MRAVAAAVLPSWLVKVIVTTIVTALLTGAGAWGVNLTSRSHNHDTRISVVEDHQKGIDKKLDSMDKKLDRLLERRP